MHSQRPSNDDNKTPPNLSETNTTSVASLTQRFTQFAMNPKLIPSPLKIRTEQDVYELLVYLMLNDIIKIETDVMGCTKIVVPDTDSLVHEFVVDTKGETYLAGHIRGFMTKKKVYNIALDIQLDEEGNPILGGRLESRPSSATIFDMTSSIKGIDNAAIPFSDFGVNTENYTYNTLLAQMVAKLNPVPGSILNVCGPLTNDAKKTKIIMPTFNGNAEYVHSRSSQINLAASDLIALGLRQKAALGSKETEDNLMHHLTRLRGELVKKIDKLEMKIEDAREKLEAQRPAYAMNINRHRQYADRAIVDIKRKYKFVCQQRNYYHQFCLETVAPSIFLVGLPFLIGAAIRLHHYDKRVIAYEVIRNFRMQEKVIENEMKTRDVQKPLLEASIAIIEKFFSAQASLTQQVIVHQGVPVSSTANQTFFATTATHSVVVPNKDDTSPKVARG